MVGIVFLLNTTYAPYMKKYISILEEENEDFEIIYWDRLGKPDCDKKYKSIVYNKPSGLGSSYKKKFFEMLGFRKFVIDTIKQRKYDKLIVLTTLTGIFLFDFIAKKYSNRFIFDIRDFTFENIYPYRIIEDLVIKRSYFTTISSEKFREFLPDSREDKYVVSHNIIREELEESRNFKRQMDNKNNLINLTFIGAVRHFDIDSKLALKLANDHRFRVVYHGYGVSSERFETFCKEHNLNVHLTGKYDRRDKMKLLSNTDIINAYYNHKNIANLYALPNKYYDSIIYKIPFWANPNVYSGQRAIKAGIGLKADLDSDSFADDLYNEYTKIDWGEFTKSCDKELSRVLEEDDYFIYKVREFIRNI